MQHSGGASDAQAVGPHSKKKSQRAAEQDRPELKAQREDWREEFAEIDPARLVFLDESGATTTMTRRHGRAPSGVRVDGAVPHGYWKIITITAAIRISGVGACLTFDGATNTACFETYVEKCLVPTLKPGDIVIMDNLSSHKTAEVARLIRSVGAEVRYLPPYSPDLNPIELMFSKLKTFLRKVAKRTVNGLIEAIGDGLRTVTPKDIHGWFHHDGYRLNQT